MYMDMNQSPPGTCFLEVIGEKQGNKRWGECNHPQPTFRCVWSKVRYDRYFRLLTDGRSFCSASMWRERSRRDLPNACKHQTPIASITTGRACAPPHAKIGPRDSGKHDREPSVFGICHSDVAACVVDVRGQLDQPLDDTETGNEGFGTWV